MTPEELWNRYAAIWSLDQAGRGPELAACLVDDATYCDPNGLVEGRDALSEYMGGFQENVPGGRFQIISVLHHHGRTIANWHLMSPTNDVLQRGTSYAAHADDGRLFSITGFFYPDDAA